MWNRITQRFLPRSVWKKFPSLEKFYTNAVGGVGDNYEVCSEVASVISKNNFPELNFPVHSL